MSIKKIDVNDHEIVIKFLQGSTLILEDKKMNWRSSWYFRALLVILLATTIWLHFFSLRIEAYTSLLKVSETISVNKNLQGNINPINPDNEWQNEFNPKIALDILRIFRRSREDTAGGNPSNSKGAGRRGKCSSTNSNLFALVPLISNSEEINTSDEKSIQREETVGFSFEISPTIWFYVANLEPEIKSAEFMIQEYLPENKHVDVIKQPLKLQLYNSDQQDVIDSAIFGVDLNIANIELQTGINYQWFLSLICGEYDGDSQFNNGRIPSRESNVDSWIFIEELTPERQNSLEELRSDVLNDVEDYENLATWYVESYGIWYDALTTLMNLKIKHGNETRLLLELLKGVGIEQAEDLVDKPVYITRPIS